MATTNRTSTAGSAADLARRLRETSFAHLLVGADGASLAAAGILADACVTTDTPYQVCVVRTRRDADARIEAADDAATLIPIGLSGQEDADGSAERPSVTAFEAADAIGVEPDPALALAGVAAGGEMPAEAAPSLVERVGFERRPGLAAPTPDPTDALAHSTLVHLPCSGDLDAAESVVSELERDGDSTGRRLASLVAIDVVSVPDATDRAAHAVERAIHPLAGGPLETIEGYGDVLCALAKATPSLAIALALGGDSGSASALDTWREHARAAHDGVRSAEIDHDGDLLVAHIDGPVETAARLVRDFQSSVPAVLAVGDGDAALATVERSAEPIAAAADAVGGSALVRAGTGYARFDSDRDVEFVDAVRGAI